MVRRDFGPYVKALAACGWSARLRLQIDMKKLFLDWAEVTRKLGKTPSMLDYEMHGKYTTKALVRNYGGWTHVQRDCWGMPERHTGRRLAGCDGDCRGRTEGGTASRTDVGEEKSDAWKTSRNQPSGVWASNDDRLTPGICPDE